METTPQPVARVSIIFTILVLIWTGGAWSESPTTCAQMGRELARLRQAYHDYAREDAQGQRNVSFDILAEMLDEIVALKRRMRKSNCKVPPRSRQVRAQPAASNDRE